MEEFKFKNSDLWCEDVLMRDVAEQFGTPLYVYSKRSVVDHCRWIETAFGDIDHLSCYAVKANANKAVLSTLAREGVGADVGSIGELHLALEAGFPAGKITFSGVGKRDDEIEYALRKDILAVNAESGEEIEVINAIAAGLGVRARVLLRVNFDIPSDTHPYITTGRKHNKFGVPSSRAAEILSWMGTLANVEIAGIHSHIGSQITRSDAFIKASEALIGLVHEVRRNGIGISQVNLGGGFGVQYRDFITHPLLPTEAENPEVDVMSAKLLQAMLPVLRESRCKILIQPGRSIVAHAGILLTKVLYRKETEGKNFIIIDAGMNDLIRPSLYRSYHQIVPVHLADTGHETVDVVGPLCESGDFFALDRAMPKVGRGDLLAVMCAGAYGFVLSSNYNGRPRPAEIFVDGNRPELVTPRERIEQL